ncbi:MAG TPA: 23S rRNA (uracil(1939)-C(5))-methyltransferase RlmD [Bacteroidales bacterium]
MARRKDNLPLIEKLEIIDAGAEGKAVGRWNDRVVFVKFGAPGDVVDVQVLKKKKRFFEGKIVKFHEYSKSRVEPKCMHFGLCGGCKWQHLDYKEQLKFKEKQVKESLDRIAKVPYPGILPIIGSKEEYFYRNKLEFTFSDRRWLTNFDKSKEEGGPENTSGLGFHLPGLFDKVLDLEECFLQQEPSNEIRLAVRNYAIEKGLSFNNIRNHEGFLRNLLVRNAANGELMVIVVFGENHQDEIKNLLDFLSKKFPEITSLMYVVNTKVNDIISDLEIQLFKGKAFLTEEMPAAVEGQKRLQFEVGPVSFFQTNSKQAYQLYKTAFDFADFTGDELVYDLYTGAGTIAAFVAGSVEKVIGIEYVEDAVKDARKNMLLNGISNADFYAGDLAKVLDEQFIEKHGKPDVIITDPPRAGMHENVIKQMLLAEPEKIVYVSCNPATQARDVALLHEKYDVVKVQPVDMFPQTHHVENVILLKKRV